MYFLCMYSNVHVEDPWPHVIDSPSHNLNQSKSIGDTADREENTADQEKAPPTPGKAPPTTERRLRTIEIYKAGENQFEASCHSNINR